MTLMEITTSEIFLINTISSKLMALPVLLGILFYKNLTPVFRAVFYYCLQLLIGSSVLMMLSSMNFQTLVLSHIMTFIEIQFIFTIFLFKFKIDKKRKILFFILSAIGGLIFTFVPLIDITILTYGYLTVYSNSLLIISAVIFLISNMKSYKTTDDTAAFRIFSIAIFIFFSSVFLIDFIGISDILPVREMLLLNLTKSVFYTIYCIIIAVSVFVCWRKQKQQIKTV